MQRCISCVSASSGTPQAGSADATNIGSLSQTCLKLHIAQSKNLCIRANKEILGCPVLDLPEQTDGISIQSQSDVICMLCLGKSIFQ